MIPNNLDDQFVGALCNTLMHSLWQGIILAAIAGLIVIGTRKSSSALRYNLLISALVLFAIAVSATFVGQYLKGRAIANYRSVADSRNVQLTITYRFGKTINNQRHHNANGAQSEMNRVGN